MKASLAFPVLAAMVLGCCVVSCNSSGCTEGRGSLMKAGFYDSSTGEPLTLDSLQVYGVGAPGDSAMMTPSQHAATVYMPLKSSATTTDWCIAYRHKSLDYPQLIDTLHFDYNSQPYFVSEECGVGYRYTISRLTSTHHLIDSVTVVDPLITNIDKVYVAIYFRTE